VVTVTITVTAVNHAPVAVADAYSTPEGTTLTVPAPGVLANDTDADGDTLTAVRVTSPTHGTLTLNANGSLTYIPTANYHGSDSFTYRANDGLLYSTAVTVNLTVTAPASGGGRLVYEYKASISNLEDQMSKMKYSPNVYDGSPAISVIWDSYAKASNVLKGYLVIPACLGCNEEGTDTSAGVSGLIYLIRKDDKTKGVYVQDAFVTAGMFKQGLGIRDSENMDDALANGPFSLKSMKKGMSAWMQLDYADLGPIEGLEGPTKYGDLSPWGLLGLGDGGTVDALRHGGFGKAKVPDQGDGVAEICGHTQSGEFCTIIKSISGKVVAYTYQLAVCAPAIWDICVNPLADGIMDPLTQGVIFGAWELKLNSKVTNSYATSLDGDAYLVGKLKGKYVVRAGELSRHLGSNPPF
jgi:VCBS repeat-containing protein